MREFRSWSDQQQDRSKIRQIQEDISVLALSQMLKIEITYSGDWFGFFDFYRERVDQYRRVASTGQTVAIGDNRLSFNRQSLLSSATLSM